MSHTIGAHSDDRGGESDYPCDCDQPKSVTPNNSELDEILDNLVSPNYIRKWEKVKKGYTTPIEEAKTALTAWRDKAVVEGRVEAQDSHIGRLEVLRAWAVNHEPVFENGQRAMAFTIFEIDNEIRIVRKWQAELKAQLTNKEKPNGGYQEKPDAFDESNDPRDYRGII